jgi:pimeloyl-ACP methyl ester carboxylesterase
MNSPSAFTIPEDITHHFIETPDGRKLHVAETGKGAPLIFVHGWPEFWKSWLPTVNLLNKRYRCIMPCLYGFGLSDKPGRLSDHLDADFHAGDIKFIADQLCDTPASLIGHDVGGYVLQSLGKSASDAFNGLVFFNCPTASVGRKWVEDGHVNQIWYQSFHLTELAQKLVGHSKETTRLYIDYFLQHWCYDKDCFTPVLEEWVENFSRPNALIGGFSWYKSNNEKRLETLEGRIEISKEKIPLPAAILWGQHDPILKSEWGAFVSAHFEDVTLDYAREAGHFVHVEQPALAAEFIETHIQKWGTPGD